MDHPFKAWTNVKKALPSASALQTAASDEETMAKYVEDQTKTQKTDLKKSTAALARVRALLPMLGWPELTAAFCRLAVCWNQCRHLPRMHLRMQVTLLYARSSASSVPFFGQTPKSIANHVFADDGEDKRYREVIQRPSTVRFDRWRSICPKQITAGISGSLARRLRRFLKRSPTRRGWPTGKLHCTRSRPSRGLSRWCPKCS